MLQRVCLVPRKGVLLNRNPTLSVIGSLCCSKLDVAISTDFKNRNCNQVHVLSRPFLTSPTYKCRYKVLYDGDCTLCQKEIRVLKWMSALNKKPVDFVNIASDQYNAADHKGVTYEMAMREMHVIDPQGKVHCRSEAIRQMYQAVGLSMLAAVSRLPGVDSLTDRMYVRFAEYRLQKALDNCDTGKCSHKVKQLRDKIEEEIKQKSDDGTP